MLAIIYAQLILFNVVGPFLIQTVLGESPIVFGRVALSLGVAWFLGSLANRILTATFPQLPLMEIATAVAFVGSTTMAWLAVRESALAIQPCYSDRSGLHERLYHFYAMFWSEHPPFSQSRPARPALWSGLCSLPDPRWRDLEQASSKRPRQSLSLCSFVGLSVLAAIVQRTLKLSGRSDTSPPLHGLLVSSSEFRHISTVRSLA